MSIIEKIINGREKLDIYGLNSIEDTIINELQRKIERDDWNQIYKRKQNNQKSDYLLNISDILDGSIKYNNADKNPIFSYKKESWKDNIILQYNVMRGGSYFRDIEEPLEERGFERVEVTETIDIPEEFQEVYQELKADHPGLRFTKKETFTNTQHEVEILTFEYEQDGTTKNLYVVAKDQNATEQNLPEILEQAGIETPKTYCKGNKVFTQYIGDNEFRDKVKTASEAEVIDLSKKAVDKLAQLQVYTTAILQQTNLPLGYRDFQSTFYQRFVQPISQSNILTPKAIKLMQAYQKFAKPKGFSFVHGDFHSGNLKLNNGDVVPLDFEWSAHGIGLEDLSRFTNSITKDRPDIDQSEFTLQMYQQFVGTFNELANETNTKRLTYNPNDLNTTHVQEQLDKSGGAIVFLSNHPDLKKEHEEKAAKYFENAVRMLDGMNNAEAYHLRTALVDFAADSPIETVKQSALSYQKYENYKSPIILAA